MVLIMGNVFNVLKIVIIVIKVIHVNTVMKDFN